MAQSAGKPRGGKGDTPVKAASADNGRAEAGAAQSMTDLDFLRGLIAAVDQSGIDSLEINRSGTRIRIAKTPAAAAVHTSAYPSYAPPPMAPPVSAQPQAIAAAPATTGAATAGAAPAQAAEAAAPAGNLVDVKSPMVGTYYRAPAPEAPPYVEIGSQVSKGQTLCILEAMKLMNELQCEQDGIIREILVDDADPVEYGQVLFRVEPTGSR